MAKKLTAKDKIDILKIYLPMLKDKVKQIDEMLTQAQEDWVNSYSVEGDKTKVRRNPIFSVVEGQVKVEFLRNLIVEVERILKE